MSKVGRKHQRENRYSEIEVQGMPSDVIRAVCAIVSAGREAIVKKEHGKWVVIENGRRLVYKEN